LILEFVELAVLLVHVVQGHFVKLLLALSIDLLRYFPDLFRDKVIQGFDQRPRLGPATPVLDICWLQSS